MVGKWIIGCTEAFLRSQAGIASLSKSYHCQGSNGFLSVLDFAHCPCSLCSLPDRPKFSVCCPGLPFSCHVVKDFRSLTCCLCLLSMPDITVISILTQHNIARISSFGTFLFISCLLLPRPNNVQSVWRPLFQIICLPSSNHVLLRFY
jgi:hypothetical protein